MERAIRLAPKAEVAKTAYSFLEAYAMMGFIVSERGVLPSEPPAYLGELRQLMDRAQ